MTRRIAGPSIGGRVVVDRADRDQIDEDLTTEVLDPRDSSGTAVGLVVRVRRDHQNALTAEEVVAHRLHGRSYSTVTDFARLRGLSMSYPRDLAISAASICRGTVATSGWNIAGTLGSSTR